ncbi:DgyrCDS8099 [Dimorphilus gyrociliatus]|uniref:DgyrCDS8099 n=1 Tax=Dimorphilus gyrociliatus TaxID=2664684 RepID=A0A7I8VT68_9ANNE|nr:DgyrCDS8099 [Dimorphilus gyrociliatus]
MDYSDIRGSPLTIDKLYSSVNSEKFANWNGIFTDLFDNEKECKGADSSSGIASASSPDEAVTERPSRWRHQTSDVVRNYVASQLYCSPVYHLPDFLLVKIFSYLDAHEISKCASVSRAWYSAAWDPSLWRHISLKHNDIDADYAIKALTKRLSYDTPTICVSVESLDLSNTRLSDNGLRIIGRRCPELRSLVIRKCSAVTNVGICEIVSRCVNLNQLDASGCPNVSCLCLSPSASAHLPAHAKRVYVRNLDLSECSALEDTGLHLIASYCNQLQYVYLRKCIRITDIGLQYLASLCSNIKELSVSDCPSIGDAGICQTAERLQSSLRYLSIAKCENITDTSLISLAKYCKRLRYLNARSCAITDRGLSVLCRSLGPRLKSLDVGKTAVSDLGVCCLAENCTQVRKLSLKSSKTVTDQGIVSLAKTCVYLHHLNIHDCHLLTWRSYRAIKRSCKRCVIEHSNPTFF